MQRAFMELTDGTYVVRLIYRQVAFGFFADEEAAREGLELIKKRLASYFSQADIEDNIPMIIWRTRPTIERTYDHGIRLYMRFATSPPVSDEFWKKYGLEEGAAS